MVIMDIKDAIQVSDLRHKNKLFKGDNLPCCLSAIGFVDDNWGDKTAVTGKYVSFLTAEIAAIHPNRSHVLFCHSGWLESNRIHHYKKLWKNLLDAGIDLPTGNRSIEIIRSRNNTILFSGYIELDRLQPDVLSKLLINENRFVLAFCKKNEIENVYALFAENDTPDQRVGLIGDTPWMVEALCDGKASFYKPYGWVDERYSGLIYIYKPGDFSPPPTSWHAA
jgi:hypothetical protein